MGIGASVFLLAVGAVLAFAVHATVSGLDISVVGYILMVAGVIGLIVSLIAASSMRGRRDDVAVEERRY
jgi:FtsH-binding integral membrane protein